jgi:hypothetical protein
VEKYDNVLKEKNYNSIPIEDIMKEHDFFRELLKELNKKLDKYIKSEKFNFSKEKKNT